MAYPVALFAFLIYPYDHADMTESRAGATRRPRRPSPDVTPQDLVEARTRLGMTLDQLALEVGISARTLGSWERGDVVPNRVTLGKLRAYLERRRVKLGPSDVPSINPVAQAILDDPALSSRDKQTLIALLESLRDR